MALAEQIVDIPVPQVRRGSGGGLQGSRAGLGSTAADVEQIVEISDRKRGLEGFRPGQSSTASSSSRLLFKWFFALSPLTRKVRR